MTIDDMWNVNSTRIFTSCMIALLGIRSFVPYIIFRWAAPEPHGTIEYRLFALRLFKLSNEHHVINVHAFQKYYNSLPDHSQFWTKSKVYSHAIFRLKIFLRMQLMFDVAKDKKKSLEIVVDFFFENRFIKKWNI